MKISTKLVALAILVIFAFPLKVGIKIDPAIYAAIARNVAEGFNVWPLSLPHLFPSFYEHPPFVIWIMGGFIKLFGANNLAASLFSKLCALLSFCLLIHLLRQQKFRFSKFTSEPLDNLSIVAAMLLLTWIPWVKYVGDAQLEGPLSLVILASFYWMLKANFNQSSPSRLWIIGILLGFAGFAVKGIIFLPIVLAAFVWSLFLSINRNSSVMTALSMLIGYIGGCLLMFLIDKKFGTTWSDYYWSRVLAWGFQGSNQFQTGEPIYFGDLLSRAFLTLSTEVKKSPLWTPFLWASMTATLLTLLKAKSLKSVLEKLRKHPQLSLSFIFYWAFLTPFMVAKTKMPHWPVPIYPVMVVFLVELIPAQVWQWSAWIKIKHYFIHGVIVVGILLATVPYRTESNWGRGEEWVYHKNALQHSINSDNPLIVVQDNLPMFMVYGYSQWFWGYSMPRHYVTIKDVSEGNCKPQQFLWVNRDVALQNRDLLVSKNWIPVLHQHKNIYLMECSTKNL